MDRFRFCFCDILWSPPRLNPQFDNTNRGYGRDLLKVLIVCNGTCAKNIWEAPARLEFVNYGSREPNLSFASERVSIVDGVVCSGTVQMSGAPTDNGTTHQI